MSIDGRLKSPVQQILDDERRRRREKTAAAVATLMDWGFPIVIGVAISLRVNTEPALLIWIAINAAVIRSRLMRQEDGNQ